MSFNHVCFGGESRWVFGLSILIAVASIAGLFIGRAVGVPVSLVYWGYIKTILVAAPLAGLLFAVPTVLAAMMRGVKTPLSKCREHFTSTAGLLDGMVGTLGPIILTPFLMGAFGTFKQIMPLVAPFAWGDTFAEFGRLIFFGYRPWQVTHAVFGTPFATQVINGIYFAWLPLLFFSVFGFATLAPPYLRARFFVSFHSSWLILGVVAAYLLSSAGPCYASLVGASADFTPLMHRLHGFDHTGQMLGTIKWQDELWQANAHHRYGFGLGISAMPSMHNAIAFLYVLSAARGRLFVRAAAWIFAVAILIGSVHLGWHYLADGLVAWAGMAGVWWLAGHYLEWCGYNDPSSERRDQSNDGRGLPQPGLA